MDTKKCSTCGETYLLEEFPKNKKNKDGRHHDCKDCKNAKNRKAYRSKDKIARYNREAHQRRKERYYGIIKNYLGTDNFTCSSCGYTYHTHAPFDWHHIDPSTKEYEVSSMVRHTEERIINELDKCVLLCSNCHRILHNEEDKKED